MQGPYYGVLPQRVVIRHYIGIFGQPSIALRVSLHKDISRFLSG